MLRNAGGGGGINFSGKKRYERVRFNVISIMRGWVQFTEKKHYITFELPHTCHCLPESGIKMVK